MQKTNGNIELQLYSGIIKSNLKMEPTHDAIPDIPAGPAPKVGNTNPAESGSKEKTQRLLDRGLKWLSVGILLMAVSFGINFFMFQVDKSFISAMYILTSLGAVCIVKGLVDILG